MILAVLALLYHYAALRGFRHARCHEDHRNIKVPYTYGEVLLAYSVVNGKTIIINKLLS
jgi:hypothetical protein